MGEHKHVKPRGGTVQTADERRRTAEPRQPRMSKRELERRLRDMAFHWIYAGIDDLIDLPTPEEMEGQT